MRVIGHVQILHVVKVNIKLDSVFCQKRLKHNNIYVYIEERYYLSISPHL